MKRGENNMDHSIKNKLDSLELPFDEAAWDAMSEKLNKAGAQPSFNFTWNKKYLLISALYLSDGSHPGQL